MSNFNISENTLNALVRVTEYGKPFYASELGLDGGTINALRTAGFITPTGETKSELVNIYDDMYKKIEVSQWKIYPRAKDMVAKELDRLLRIYNAL